MQSKPSKFKFIIFSVLSAVRLRNRCITTKHAVNMRGINFSYVGTTDFSLVTVNDKSVCTNDDRVTMMIVDDDDNVMPFVFFLCGDEQQSSTTTY